MTLVPPTDPVYRRYWRRVNRPYAGCGCLYALLLFALGWWLLSLIYPPAAAWFFWF